MQATAAKPQGALNQSGSVVQEKPKTIRVVPIEGENGLASSLPRGHHKRKLVMPSLPEDIFEGMTALERQHFEYFVASFQQDYPGMTPSDLLCLNQAALEYINLLRVQARQMKTGEVISMARQHPGVQLRQWLDAMSVTRKQRQANQPKKDEEKEATKQLLAGLFQN